MVKMNFDQYINLNKLSRSNTSNMNSPDKDL